MRNTKSLDLPSIPDGSQETIFEYVVDDNGTILLRFSDVLATASNWFYRKTVVFALHGQSLIWNEMDASRRVANNLIAIWLVLKLTLKLY